MYIFLGVFFYLEMLLCQSDDSSPTNKRCALTYCCHVKVFSCRSVKILKCQYVEVLSDEVSNDVLSSDVKT